MLSACEGGAVVSVQNRDRFDPRPRSERFADLLAVGAHEVVRVELLRALRVWRQSWKAGFFQVQRKVTIIHLKLANFSIFQFSNRFLLLK